MIEFILRGEPDEDFGLHASKWKEALVPQGYACETPAGSGERQLELWIDGVRVTFSPEPVGWQVCFEGTPDEDWAAAVAQAILASLCRVSGQAGRVVPL